MPLIPDKVISGEELAQPLQIRTAWLYGLEAAAQKVPAGKEAVLPTTLGRLSAIREQDLSTERKQTPSLNIGLINAVAYSPDGKVIASGSRDKTVRRWDPNSPIFRLIYDFDPAAVATALRFLWEMQRDELQIKLQSHPPALFPELDYHITWTDETRKLRPLLDMPNPDETKLGQVVRFLEAQCAYKDPEQKAACEAKKP